jgi:hypothetical protein
VIAMGLGAAQGAGLKKRYATGNGDGNKLTTMMRDMLPLPS